MNKKQNRQNSPKSKKSAQSPQSSEQIEQFDIVRAKPGAGYEGRLKDHEYTVADIYNSGDLERDPLACITRPLPPINEHETPEERRAAVFNLPVECLELVRKADQPVLPKGSIEGVYNRGGFTFDTITVKTIGLDHCHFTLEGLIRDLLGFHPEERPDIPDGSKVQVTFEVLEVPPPPKPIEPGAKISDQFEEKPF